MRTAVVAAIMVLIVPRASAEPPADPWGVKPVWVASTVARLYDISPDGKRFLLADGRKFGCFDRAAGKMVWIIDNTTIHDAKFSPDGKTVAAGEWQNGVNFYEAASGDRLHRVPPGEERPGQVHYRADGMLLYHTSASLGGAAPPWTLKYSIVHYDPAKQKALGKHSGSITYSSTNPWLWHRGAGFVMEHHQIDGTDRTTWRRVNYTDPLSGKKTPTIDLHVNDIPLELSPDGKLLVVVTLGEQPRLVDTATGKTLHTLEGHKRQVTDAAYSSDGKLVAIVTGTWSNIATRGAVDSGMGYSGPAEFAVWDAATGKLVSRAAFPTSELDFIGVRFSRDSKFAVATSRVGSGGKGRALVAFGTVPFGREGNAALGFPRDEDLKPKVVSAPGAGVVADALDRLIDELAKSNKPAGDKVDALFLAALGRFATAIELQRVKARYGDKWTADSLRKLLAEIAATPEFEAHLKSLQKRLPEKAAAPAFPGFPGSPFPGGPFHGGPLPISPLPGGSQFNNLGQPGNFGQPGVWPADYPNGWSGPWSWPSAPPPSSTPKK